MGGLKMDDTPHILIVEDDAGVAQGLVHGLRQAGFRTTLAVNGEQGLQLVLAHSFVLLDLMLPGRTGFEVLEAMCTRVSVPTIVLSAPSDLPARLKSFENLPVDFVPEALYRRAWPEFASPRSPPGRTRRRWRSVIRHSIRMPGLC